MEQTPHLRNIPGRDMGHLPESESQTSDSSLDAPGEEEHLPSPSFWPILLAFGMVLIAIGVIFSLVISVIGVALLLASMVGWMLENRANQPHGDEDEIY